MTFTQENKSAHKIKHSKINQKYKLIILVFVLFYSYNKAQAQYIEFEHDGIDRQYIYYEPVDLNEQMPLVIVMHGFGGDANDIRNYSEMNQFANQYGFAVCYPRGTTDSEGYRFWNVGYAFHQNETIDDVGFLTELVGYLQLTHGLNPDYTFATGMSNGGDMCYMLACQAYDTFKAVAPVAGMILQDILDECDNSPPIPLFEIHGSQDSVTPISGDPNNNDGWGAYPSIPFTIDYFSEKNECTLMVTETLPNTDTSDGSYVLSEKHLNGINNNEVWFYKVVGGGHDWPGAWGNMDINAGEEAWLFFQNHIDNTLSLPNFKDLENTIRVFPNPTSNVINIETNNRLELFEVILYNTLGVNLNLKSTDGFLDVTHLNTGIYLLSIKTSKGTITKQIVKN
ncbi:MAG: T9SS type A sorting domain-containing protein [Flavobacteriaceae bacterium]|nr:T9SS type A sorting domain-containing protein [Flavobacteriaceae bacterium]MBT3919213.1 T9SS type A sorting domain-containing protein [Flavobacteriaceae bacterium]MBT6704345.1 T9SS type A sorting domain-containing protein [Flavobacteriaceae bacterium]|tara:strand:+ start:5241 stop:6431 length:1191 start_codon:yes stop_codon:yes gene_type:complete